MIREMTRHNTLMVVFISVDINPFPFTGNLIPTCYPSLSRPKMKYSSCQFQVDCCSFLFEGQLAYWSTHEIHYLITCLNIEFCGSRVDVLNDFFPPPVLIKTDQKQIHIDSFLVLDRDRLRQSGKTLDDERTHEVYQFNRGKEVTQNTVLIGKETTHPPSGS